MIVTFFGATIIGVVKMYFMKGLPDPPEVVAKQLELLLDRNFQIASFLWNKTSINFRSKYSELILK
jgi:hypothetical protein